MDTVGKMFIITCLTGSKEHNASPAYEKPPAQPVVLDLDVITVIDKN